MLSNIRLVLTLAFISLTAFPSITEGGVQYSFHFDQSQYSVSAGGTVNVNVYLRESFDTLFDTTLLDAEGLFGAGVRILFNESPIPGDPATVLTIGDIHPNLGFDNTATIFDLVGGTSAGFVSNIGVSLPPLAAEVGTSFHQILLGTFTFTAGLNPGEVTHLRATDFDLNLDDTVTGVSIVPLDLVISDGIATIVVDGVQAVPEPSSIVVFGATAFMLVGFRRRLLTSKPGI